MATGHGGGGLFQWASNTPKLTSASGTSAFLGRSKWSNPFSPLAKRIRGRSRGGLLSDPPPQKARRPPSKGGQI